MSDGPTFGDLCEKDQDLIKNLVYRDDAAVIELREGKEDSTPLSVLLKKIGAALLLVLLCALPMKAQTTATVQGTIQDLGTNTVSNNTFVRLYLRGCNGNPPRINGTAIIAPTLGSVYYKDFLPNSSGVISGTIYATRDSTGLLGGSVECGGSKTSEWYGLTICVNGKCGPETAIQAKAGSTIDLSNITPITTNPVVTAPTGDSTYARLDGGNQNFTGAIGAPGISSSTTLSVTGAGTFGSIPSPGPIGGTTPNTGAFSSVNNTITVGPWTAGTDICAKIVTGIGLLPATGGTVDATAFQGTQACASNPLASLAVPLHLKLGPVIIQTTVMWQDNVANIPIYIEGVGMGNSTSSGNLTFLQYTGTGTVAAVLNLGTSTPQTTYIQQARISNMSIGGNSHVTDALFITGVHRSMFDNLDLRDVTGACFHAKFAVSDTFTKIECTSITRTFTTTPTNGLLFEETAAGFPVTAGTVTDVVVEGVSGSGIKLNGASEMIFTGGTSEDNTTRNYEDTNNGDNHDNTLVGVDMEGCGGCSEDILENGTNAVYFGTLATTKTHIGASAINAKIIGGNHNAVTIDSGATNTYFDSSFGNFAGAFTDNGTATRVGRVRNITGNIIAGIPWITRDTMPSQTSGVTTDPQDFIGAAYQFTTTPLVISNTVLTASSIWRVVFIGEWANNVEGSTLKQIAPYYEISSAANTLTIGSVTITCTENGSNQISCVTGANTAAFSGHIFVIADAGNTAGLDSLNLKGNVQATELISTGTQAALTGTGACATITTQTGGASAGSAKCTGTTGASTLTITFAKSVPNGYTCDVWDETTRANVFQQTSHSQTTCVLTVTSVTQNDVFVFKAIAF